MALKERVKEEEDGAASAVVEELAANRKWEVGTSLAPPGCVSEDCAWLFPTDWRRQVGGWGGGRCRLVREGGV